MPIIGSRVTVTTSPTPVFLGTHGSVSGPMTASILNLGPQDVDIGGAFVVSGQAYLLRVNGTFDVDLTGDDILYAITGSGTSVLCVLKLRQ